MNNAASLERGAVQLDAWCKADVLADEPPISVVDPAVHRLDVPDYSAEALKVASAATWLPPRPIVSELLPVAPLTRFLLPKKMADFVFDEAQRMPCPPDYVAAAAIVALGSVIGASCAVKPKRHDDSWLVTANLWGGVVGEPSSKKTSGINPPMKILDRLEAVEADKLDSKRALHAAEMAVYEVFKKAIEAEMKNAVAGKADAQYKDDRMAAAKHSLAVLQLPEQPYRRRFKTNDATVEKIGELLTTNPTGLLVLRDELIGLLASWDKPGHEGDRAFYLESWNGTGSFNIDRIGRGSLYVKNLCLSIFGCIQPDLLERYLEGIVHSLDNDGRIQRFQVLVFPDATEWVWVDQVPARDSRAAMRMIFDHLANFDPVTHGAKCDDEYAKLPYFSFDDPAQKIFIQWCHELHSRITSEENPLMRQHLAKFEKLFCSLALIFHLTDGKVGDIQADTTSLAAAYCQYLETHARRIYGMVEAATVTAAQLLGRRLSEGRLDNGFTARDIRRNRWSGLTAPPQVEAALDVLEDFGWVRSVETGGGVGRPTTTYLINPHVWPGK